MTVAELKLLLVILFVLSAGSWLFRLDIRKAAVVFGLGCVAGFLAQLSIGPGINRYTPNISLYVWYVSVAVIFAWGTGLTSIWGVHLWLCRIFGLRPGLAMNLLSALPVILILETIGSNLIVMKLHGYTRFSPLMPALNAMHAPVWLYVYYLFVAFVFYHCLKALSMHTEDWSGALLLGNARNTATRALFVQERGLDGDGANGDESQESEGGELAVCGATAARGEKQGRVAGRQGFEPR